MSTKIYLFVVIFLTSFCYASQGISQCDETSLDSMTISSTISDECNFIRIGPDLTIDSNGKLKLTANIIQLKPEITIESGGELEIYAQQSAYTNVPTKMHELPEKFFIQQNYPNPFNNQTTINFALSKHTEANIKIYNINGVLISELLNENLPAGYYSIIWDASNISSGTYFIKMQAGDFVQVKKCVLLK
jgi:hypothetical protein